MPSNVVRYRDPLTGRFISGDTALGLERAIRTEYTPEGVAETVLEYGRVVEEVTPQMEVNWTEDERTWAFIWTGENNSLDLGALSVASPPEGVTQFRVIGTVANNPDYPNGYITSDWLTLDQWPPDLNVFGGRNPTGLAQVFFEKVR